MAGTDLLPGVTAAGTPDRPGGLLWAFHEGFAAYVTRLADGRVDVDGGARLQSDGRILFPLGSVPGPGRGTDPVLVGELRGSGAVHFTGHHGLLAVTLAEPAIVAGTGTPVLTIVDPFAPGHRLAFAELGTVEPGSAGPGSVPSTVRYAGPRLTEEGADLFLGHYREGTPLAPLEVTPAAPGPATTTPAPAAGTTPTSDPTPTSDQTPTHPDQDA